MKLYLKDKDDFTLIGHVFSFEKAVEKMSEYLHPVQRMIYNTRKDKDGNTLVVFKEIIYSNPEGTIADDDIAFKINLIATFLLKDKGKVDNHQMSKAVKDLVKNYEVKNQT